MGLGAQLSDRAWLGLHLRRAQRRWRLTLSVDSVGAGLWRATLAWQVMMGLMSVDWLPCRPDLGASLAALGLLTYVWLKLKSAALWRGEGLARWIDRGAGADGLVECALDRLAHDSPADLLVRRRAVEALKRRAPRAPSPNGRALIGSCLVSCYLIYDPLWLPSPQALKVNRALPVAELSARAAPSSPQPSGAPFSGSGPEVGSAQRQRRTERALGGQEQRAQDPKALSEPLKRGSAEAAFREGGAEGGSRDIQVLSTLEPATGGASSDQLEASSRLSHSPRAAKQSRSAGQGSAHQLKARYELKAKLEQALEGGADEEAPKPEPARQVELRAAHPLTSSALPPRSTQSVSEGERALLERAEHLRLLRLKEARGEHPHEHRPDEGQR